MKEVFKFILFIFIIAVTVKAYNKTNENDESLWYNVGTSSKEVVVETVQYAKPIVKSIKEGFNEQ